MYVEDIFSLSLEATILYLKLPHIYTLNMYKFFRKFFVILKNYKYFSRKSSNARFM